MSKYVYYNQQNVYIGVFRSVADNKHLPSNSSVVFDSKSDIWWLKLSEIDPPNKITTLKLCPQPNTTVEWPHLGTIAKGRVTCKNNEGWDTQVATVYQSHILRMSCISVQYAKKGVFADPYLDMIDYSWQWDYLFSKHCQHLIEMPTLVQYYKQKWQWSHSIVSHIILHKSIVGRCWNIYW